MIEELSNKGPSSFDNDGQLAGELQEAAREQARHREMLKEAESKILVAGSDEYNAAEMRKHLAQDPVSGVIEKQYRDDSGLEVVLLGTQHTYDLEGAEIQYLHRLVEAIPTESKKVLILEGQYENFDYTPDDPAEAMRVSGGEFGYMAALGRRRGIELVAGEPDSHETAKKIAADHPEISRGEIALHYSIRALVGVLQPGEAVPLAEVAPVIYHTAGIAGDVSEGGLVRRVTSRKEVMELSDDERAGIMAEMPAMVERLNEEFAKVEPGATLLELLPEGRVALGYDLRKQPVPWDPSPALSGRPLNNIARVSQLDMLARDRRTFELTSQALEQGKEPVIAVGSSHVSSLTPAFEAAFDG